MMRSRLVAARATRMALIAASVPELTKRTRSIDGISIATRRASCVSSSVGAPKLVRRAAMDQGAPRHDVVDIGVAVHIFDAGAAGARDEQRRAAHGLEGANRAVD